MIYPSSSGPLRFQATLTKTRGSRYACERILRACWLKLDKGCCRQDVLRFRDECYATFQSGLTQEKLEQPIARRRLTWMLRKDGGIYLTCLALPNDEKKLASLETEFVDDHCKMLKSVCRGASTADIAQTVGLQRNAKKRRQLISTILQHQKRTSTSFTLKCINLPSKDETPPEVVAYLHVRLEADDDNKQAGRRHGRVIVSHLKVCKKHPRQGCATLLLAAAARQVERCAIKAPAGVPWWKHWKLSVVAKNRRANKLYQKLVLKWQEKSKDRLRGYRTHLTEIARLHRIALLQSGSPIYATVASKFHPRDGLLRLSRRGQQRDQ